MAAFFAIPAAGDSLILGTMPFALDTLRMSSHFAAADIFGVAPLASAGPIFHGVRKAMI